MTVVLDASVVVSALVDGGRQGRWSEEVVASGDGAALHLLAFRAASILRRSAVHGHIASETAAAAHSRSVRARHRPVPYELLADRAWALSDDLTMYDAAYVSLAERLGAPLATLDVRLVRATGPTCAFRSPPRPGPTRR